MRAIEISCGLWGVVDDQGRIIRSDFKCSADAWVDHHTDEARDDENTYRRIRNAFADR